MTVRGKLFSFVVPGIAALASVVTAGAQTCLLPPANMIGWWPGDSDARDIAGANDGTLEGNATFAPGFVGDAFQLDGNGDYVSVPHAPELSFVPTEPMSVEMWAFADDTDPLMHILGKRAGCIQGINYQMAVDLVVNSYLGYEWGGNAPSAAYTGLDLPRHQWNHLAGTFDGMTFKLYLNGQMVASANGAFGDENAAPLLIGDSGTCMDGWRGRIDEFAIYGRALDDSEIQAIFDAGPEGKCKCPALFALGRTTTGSTFQHILESIYDFRDTVLQGSQKGRGIVQLFYRHRLEGLSLMMRHPELRTRARDLLIQLHPMLESLAAGRSVRLPHADRTALESLMQAFHAKGSADLRETLDDLRRQMLDGEFLSMFGISSPGDVANLGR